MKMTFAAFSRLCDRVGELKPPDPAYIPSEEEIEKLEKLTKAIRPAFSVASERARRNHANSSYHIGRPYVIEKDLSFITQGCENEPLIPELNFYSFLVYISETAHPARGDGAAAARLASLNRYLRENLIIT